MKQEIIDKAAEYTRTFRELQKLSAEILTMAHQAEQKAIELLRQNCDHDYLDGTSVIEGNMFCNTCKICPWSDM